MTELATIPNNLGFLVFDLAGKKVRACLQLLTPWSCNAARRLLRRASLTARIQRHSSTCLGAVLLFTHRLIVRPLIFLPRDAHALVGCSEKKQQLKRIMVAFDDKE
jgi:hypothetical protein